MYWKVTREEGGKPLEREGLEPSGRFVLQRHCDAGGPHLDLRLELDGYLSGWRLEADSLEGEILATEKGPHPVHWLEHAGDALREDAGIYVWLDQNRDERRILLVGQKGECVLRARREAFVGARDVCEIVEALRDGGAGIGEAGKLIRDGVSARRRAVERLRGLGRELDGDAFDDALWRKTLERCSLEEIHVHLRSYEVRFDNKYPPVSVSRPERLDGETSEGRAESMRAILRDEY